MGDYVKKTLLNLKDFEQKVIENYPEKYQLNKQQAEHNKKILQNSKKNLIQLINNLKQLKKLNMKQNIKIVK